MRHGWLGGRGGGRHARRAHTMVGGGYEHGGDVAAVSYSPRFGGAVRALYQTAVAHG